MGAASSLGPELASTRRDSRLHIQRENGEAVILTHMITHQSRTRVRDMPDAFLSLPTLSLLGARGMESDMALRVGGLYPMITMTSSTTDRTVMLMEALVEFLEAVEGTLHREEPPNTSTTPAVDTAAHFPPATDSIMYITLLCKILLLIVIPHRRSSISCHAVPHLLATAKRSATSVLASLRREI